MSERERERLVVFAVLKGLSVGAGRGSESGRSARSLAHSGRVKFD